MIFRKIERYLYPMLSRGQFYSDKQMYLYLILATACLFATLVHVALLLFHFICGLQMLIAANFASLLLLIFICRLIQKGRFKAAGLLITLDVFAYCTLSVILIGGGHDIAVYLFILLVMQMIIPYASLAVRGTMVALCWLGAMGVLCASFYYTPPYQLEAWVAMTVLNANIGFAGVVIELCIGNLIKRVITQYNTDRIKELSAQAYTDSLTGLYNRRYAERVFTRLTAVGDLGRWCVAIIDVDNFKRINDQYGHCVGDEILVSIGSYLKRALRKTDLVFRWGGEEFLVLLEADINTAKTILEKLRAGIAQQVTRTDSGLVRSTVTIGAAALYPSDISGSICRCDQKLYGGKRAGKNQVVL